MVKRNIVNKFRPIYTKKYVELYLTNITTATAQPAKIVKASTGTTILIVPLSVRDNYNKQLQKPEKKFSES